MDPRIEKLSDLLINFSCAVKPGENVLIRSNGDHVRPLITKLISDVYKAGGNPFLELWSDETERALLMGANEKQLQMRADHDLELMKKMDCFISVRASDNVSELSDVPADKLKLASLTGGELLSYRVENTRWAVLRYPNKSMAQLSNMSSEAFEDFYFKVCTLDYAKMDKAMDALKARMEAADRVRLTGKGLELEFSIKDIPVIKCAGKMNIPDGEVYTAPVKDSINGHISYNTPSLQNGFTYENIQFDIENGKIVKATANDNDKINALLDTDEGSRYFGEFAIGVNPYVLSPMKDTLFDEKICGSFHLTPGRSYDDADNGNKSSVHWDLVYIQRPEYGGGEIWFDGELIRRDGLFVPEDLKCLNPENLK